MKLLKSYFDKFDLDPELTGRKKQKSFPKPSSMTSEAGRLLMSCNVIKGLLIDYDDLYDRLKNTYEIIENHCGTLIRRLSRMKTLSKHLETLKT